MQRINLLIQKLADMAGSDKDKTVIDIDLMLDYTRVLYADLLELRKNKLLMPVPDNAPEQQDQSAPEPAIAATEPIIVTTNIEEVPTIDIRTNIGINDKYLYISELFMDDKSAYDAAVKELNKCNNLHEAISFTDNELNNKYNWDKESLTVQSFYTLLSSSFPSM